MISEMEQIERPDVGVGSEESLQLGNANEDQGSHDGMMWIIIC